MAPADDVDAAAKASPLYAKYGDARRQPERARAAGRAPAKPAAARTGAAPQAEAGAEHKKAAKATAGGAGRHRRLPQLEAGKQIQREVVRGVFGLLRRSSSVALQAGRAGYRALT